MKYIRQLDGVRGIAVLLVFAAHAGLDRLVPGGLGVTIFFFLSGYLITTLLRCEFIRHGRIDIRDFYLRRTLRIWPPLYVTMALMLPLMWLLPGANPSWSGILSQLAFTSNYLEVGNGLAMPLWSLAVEEHFYVVFPLLFSLALSKTRDRSAFLICLGICTAILLIRLLIIAEIGPHPFIYFWTHTRADSILAGCCLALWKNPRVDAHAWHPGNRGAAIAIAALLGTLAIRDEVFRQGVRYSIQGAAIGILFCWIMEKDNRLTKLLSSEAAHYLGRYSYTFYLAHLFVLEVIRARFPEVPPLSVAIFGFWVSLGYAALMNKLVEMPIHRWRAQLNAWRERRAYTAHGTVTCHPGATQVLDP